MRKTSSRVSKEIPTKKPSRKKEGIARKKSSIAIVFLDPPKKTKKGKRVL